MIDLERECVYFNDTFLLMSALESKTSASNWDVCNDEAAGSAVLNCIILPENDPNNFDGQSDIQKPVANLIILIDVMIKIPTISAWE